MSSKTRIKIFLKKNNELLNFMWADVSKDGSVMMGVHGTVAFKSGVEKIFSKEGDLIPGKDFQLVDSEEATKNTKITFHTSGFYKLSSKIQKESIDRATIKSIPLKEINEPTRMLEVLIPAKIEISTRKYREGKDAVIDITEFPHKPLRCTVTCMSLDRVDKFNQSRIVDTSIVETSCVFVHANMAWAWTLRISKDDINVLENKFLMFVPGEIVWPKSD